MADGTKDPEQFVGANFHHGALPQDRVDVLYET